MHPRTRYVRGPEGHVAYQVFGRGPRDIVFVPDHPNNIEIMWEEPALARFPERLATMGRVICFDTGECERMGDNVGGIAVHIGARIAAEAEPDEVLASSTVKDLVVGSGLSFQDRGNRALRGVEGEWRLFAAT